MLLKLLRHTEGVGCAIVAVALGILSGSLGAEEKNLVFLDLAQPYQEAFEKGEFGPSELAEDLLDARRLDAKEIAQFVLALPVDANAMVADQTRLLEAAFRANDSELVQHLLQLGANPAYIETSVLEELVRSAEHQELIDQLILPREIMGSALVDALTFDTPLGLTETIAFEPAAVNWANDRGITPLIQAAIMGDRDMVQVLLDHGAATNLSGEQGLTPLTAAILSGDQGTLERLLEAQPLIDYAGPDGMRPLLAALGEGNKRAVGSLLEAGASPHKLPEDPIDPGVLARNLGLDQLFRKHGGMSGADLPSLISAGKTEQALKRIASDANPNAVSGNGYPAVHLAILKNQPKILKALLEAGANIRAVDPEGLNLFFAVARAQEDCVFCLYAISDFMSQMVNKAELKDLALATDNDGRTPILNAVMAENELVLRWFIDKFPDTAGKPDEDGMTPVLAATVIGQAEWVALLVKAWPMSVETMRREGLPLPQDVARHNKDYQVLSVLPDDRTITADIRKGLSRDDARALQRQLEAWGYYKGAIDGLLGVGSGVAMEAFLLDRKQEIKAMATTGRSVRGSLWERIEFNNAVEYRGKEILISRQPRTWRVIEWKGGGGRSYIGFNALADRRLAQGFGLDEYVDQMSNEGRSVSLFGPNGRTDERIIHAR